MIRTRAYYQVEYVDKERSFHDLAEEHKTYPNKIRREVIACGFKPRNKSAAQKAALKTGRHKHPTKGKVRPLPVRLKIAATINEKKQDATKDKGQ